MLQKSELNRLKVNREMKRNPLLSIIKRGKLGTDTFFIAFAICGGLMLPLYFYEKFKKNKQLIINSRIASP
jgi:hypothetical protein